MIILTTANLGSNFTGSYKKNNSIPQQEEGNHYSVIKGGLYRSADALVFYFIFRARVFLFIK